MELFQGTGPKAAANAVLALLQRNDGIEGSWNGAAYQARPTVAEWHNCREQGYVISMRTQDLSKQINVAFFEHRNSDSICAVAWEQTTINPPTIDTAEFGNIYKDKYDVSHSVKCTQHDEMAEWISDQLVEFWQ